MPSLSEAEIDGLWLPHPLTGAPWRGADSVWLTCVPGLEHYLRGAPPWLQPSGLISPPLSLYPLTAFLFPLFSFF